MYGPALTHWLALRNPVHGLLGYGRWTFIAARETLQNSTTDHCLLIVAAVIRLKYWRYVKHYSINQSINNFNQRTN